WDVASHTACSPAQNNPASDHTVLFPAAPLKIPYLQTAASAKVQNRNLPWKKLQAPERYLLPDQVLVLPFPPVYVSQKNLHNFPGQILLPEKKIQYIFL